MERPQPIKNPALMEAIAQAKKDPGVENTVKLLNEVVSAKLLIPVSMDRGPKYDSEKDEIVIEKDTQINFELIKSSEGALYYPVFTDGVEMSKCDLDEEPAEPYHEFQRSGSHTSAAAECSGGIRHKPDERQHQLPCGHGGSDERRYGKRNKRKRRRNINGEKPCKNI